jgi:Helix-turn-helix domain
MESTSQIATATHRAKPEADPQNGFEQLYRIAEVAKILHISRASVYNLLRGERIVDLGGKGKKGMKLVPASVLREILERKMKTFR